MKKEAMICLVYYNTLSFALKKWEVEAKMSIGKSLATQEAASQGNK
ncbi:hypothetical protein KZ483_24895 [Paenibacillus sp. sptzw28]|nr:hypothetical protein [Paenibacillus sp. sptzw28]QYR20947.1 hypothetical protein KZ483_24895 [Paenibacillus sp. sptzw28]